MTALAVSTCVCTASSVTTAPSSSSNVSSTGTAGISFDFSSTDSCRRTSRVSVAKAVIVCSGDLGQPQKRKYVYTAQQKQAQQ